MSNDFDSHTPIILKGDVRDLQYKHLMDLCRM